MNPEVEPCRVSAIRKSACLKVFSLSVRQKKILSVRPNIKLEYSASKDTLLILAADERDD
jgi:hypothetical protein